MLLKCCLIQFRGREREREMFYLTTHSTHFIYGYMASDMVKDHSDSEKGNPLPPYRLLLSINNKGYFICIIPHRITHTTACVTPVVEHWLEREIAQWVHPMKDRSDSGEWAMPPNQVALPMLPYLRTHHFGLASPLYVCCCCRVY